MNAVVPGKTRAAEVAALIGEPAERLQGADGGSVWFYPGPVSRQTHAVRIGSDGIVRAVEERLTQDNFNKLVRHQSTMKDVRALLGPPSHVTYFSLAKRRVWDYPTLYYQEKRIWSLQFSDDGILRETYDMYDFDADPPERGMSRR